MLVCKVCAGGEGGYVNCVPGDTGVKMKTVKPARPDFATALAFAREVVFSDAAAENDIRVAEGGVLVSATLRNSSVEFIGRAVGCKTPIDRTVSFGRPILTDDGSRLLYLRDAEFLTTEVVRIIEELEAMYRAQLGGVA